jgi:predicted nucleic acid-binding Zn ribbon protein
MTEAQPIATEGPCQGHACDGCATCRRGRCCRKDRPDYRRPEVGDWDGPVFGELGVLRHEDGRLQCHACGGWYRHLGAHAFQRHALLAREYRALFGLRARTSLRSPDLDAWAREHFRPILSRYWGTGGVVFLTSEERSRNGRGRHWPLEALLDPHLVEVRKESGRKGSATQRRRLVEGEIVRPQPKPADPAATRAKAQERLGELWQDPEWRARTVTNIKAGQWRSGYRRTPDGPTPQPCIVCGTTFSSRTGRRTCSDACEQARRRQPRGGRKTTTCRVCGTSFISLTGRRTCSEACAQTAIRDRPRHRLSEVTRKRISEAHLHQRLALAPTVAEALAAGGEALLSVRDREMVARFYGVNDGQPWPLPELEEAYRLTEGGVHRAVKKAVERILAASGHNQAESRGVPAEPDNLDGEPVSQFPATGRGLPL